MSVKTERVTILTSPDFKKFLNAEAEKQGVSVSELIRVRCTSAPNNKEDEALLAVMVQNVNKSTLLADKSLSKGLKELDSALKEIRKGRS